MAAKSAQSKDFYFVIVAPNDAPLFEQTYSAYPKQAQEVLYLNQLVAHASLDVVDEQTATQQTMYMPRIDRFNDWMVSAFVTASKTRFILLHTVKADDAIRNFFTECYECYIKMTMNPFFSRSARITSPAFEARMQSLSKKYLLQ